MQRLVLVLACAASAAAVPVVSTVGAAASQKDKDNTKTTSTVPVPVPVPAPVTLNAGTGSSGSGGVAGDDATDGQDDAGDAGDDAATGTTSTTPGTPAGDDGAAAQDTAPDASSDDTPAPDSGGEAKAKGKGKAAKDKTDTSRGSDHAEDDVVLDPPADPVAGQTVNAAGLTGKVVVHLPHNKGKAGLGDLASLPTGSVIDATKGTVSLVTAVAGGGTQTATFGKGAFEVRQVGTQDPITELRLKAGNFGLCKKLAPVAGARIARSHASHKVIRSLWGHDDHGRFRTVGRGSVATVRGTRWLTQDRCDGTLTKVTEGAVSVYDKRTHRTVLVTAGHAYLAHR